MNLVKRMLWFGCALLFGTALHADAAVEPLSAFPQTLLAIKTQDGRVHHFNVWIADQQARQEQGLMFISKLEDHHGMLFVYSADRGISMWMKNTLIPLDMVFVRADGTISYIAENAQPQSLAIISAPEKARSVLEIGGGDARRLKIKPGDHIYCGALQPTLRKAL